MEEIVSVVIYGVDQRTMQNHESGARKPDTLR